jgi:hypothetical protein
MSFINFIADDKLLSILQRPSNEKFFTYLDMPTYLEQQSFFISKKHHHPDALPSAFVAGLLLSDANANLKSSILAHCKKLFPYFNEDMIFIVSRLDSEVSDWITRATISFSQMLAEQASRAEQENAEIRLLYDKAQAAIFEIERSQNTFYTPKVVLQIIPGKRQNNVSTSPIQIKIAKEPAALHAIDLFFDRKPYIVSSADIIVELNGGLTGRRLATWCVPEVKLLEGWNRFYCPTSDEPIGEHIVLSVRTTGIKTQFVLRAAANAENLKGVSMYPENQEPIAIRLWSGLLGVKLPQTGPGHFVKDEDQINPAAVSHAEFLHLGSAVEKEHTELVKWEDTHGGLLVHPRGIIPVVACIPMLQVVDLSAVHITCKLSHSDAPTTDFAAWIIRADERVSVRSPWQRNEGSVSRLFSSRKNWRGAETTSIPKDVNWLTLLGGQEGEISFTVDPPYTGHLELLLATRNHTKDNHFAWAIFTDLRFDISPP